MLSTMHNNILCDDFKKSSKKMEGYIPVYPSQDDPNIQRIVSSKREFNELLPSLDEPPVTKVRRLLNRQKLFARLTRLGDHMINIHEPGTGKTCGFIETAEQYKRSGTFTKTVIVEKNEGLINQVKEQIIKQCTPEGEYYMTEPSDAEFVTQKMQRKRENVSLSRWYSFRTYESFANELFELSDDRIRAKYSHTIIIFDEAHNINKLDDDADGEGTKNINKEIMRLTHNIEGSKIILATATPMINSPKEFAALINLLRPLDNQIKAKEYYSLEEIESYTRGKVSYIKSNLPDIDVIYEGTPMKFREEIADIEISVNMYLSSMGDLQEREYRSIDSNDALLTREAVVSTLSFPIINGIQTTSSDFIAEVNCSLVWKNNPNFLNWSERGDCLTFQEWLSNRDNLKRLSGKLDKIVEIETQNEGCSFIYSFNVEGSGVKMMERILSLYGFEQFKENNIDNIFVQGDNTKIRDSFKKKPRVAIITGSTPSNRQRSILETFNSPKNVKGEYIKILIGSSKVRDGISLSHCQRMHLIRPHWHYAGMIQSINRVLRVSGHNVLKETLKKEALELGYIEGSKEFEDYTKIKVRIYRHCIDYNLDENIRGKSKNNSDYQFMKKATEKEIKIVDVMNKIKICAVDALINKEQNQLSINDTFNYQKLNFLPTWTELQDPSYEFMRSDPTDYSTYNILYIDIQKLVDYLKDVLRRKGSISYQNIFERFNSQYTMEEIFEAIDKLKKESQYLTKEYDQKMNIEIGPNGIYVQRISQPYDERFIHNISIYDVNPVINYETTLQRYLSKHKHDIMLRKREEFIENVNNISENDKLYRSKIKTLLDMDVWERIYILEELYLAKHDISNVFSEVSSKDVNSLALLFKGYLFQIDDENENSYYIHILNTLEKENSHNALARHREPRKLTIFSPSEGFIGWREPSEYECSYFKDKIKEKIDREIEKFEENQIYGSILQDGTFRLIANLGMDEDSMDKRMGRRGKEPKSFMKEEKVKIATIERIYPNKKSQDKKYSKTEIKKFREDMKKSVSDDFINSLDDEQVIIYHIWESCTNVDSYFQPELIKKLRKDGRIYQPYVLTDKI